MTPEERKSVDEQFRELDKFMSQHESMSTAEPPLEVEKAGQVFSTPAGDEREFNEQSARSLSGGGVPPEQPVARPAMPTAEDESRGIDEMRQLAHSSGSAIADDPLGGGEAAETTNDLLREILAELRTIPADVARELGVGG